MSEKIYVADFSKLSRRALERAANNQRKSISTLYEKASERDAVIESLREALRKLRSLQPQPVLETGFWKDLNEFLGHE